MQVRTFVCVFQSWVGQKSTCILENVTVNEEAKNKKKMFARVENLFGGQFVQPYLRWIMKAL